jgi:NADPH2:quinone reductase
VFDLVKRDALKVQIGRRYTFAEAVQAHADLEAGRTVGSSILVP